MSKKVKPGVDADDERYYRQLKKSERSKDAKQTAAAAIRRPTVAADLEVVRANRMTVNLGVEIEPGEILSDNNNLLDRYICAVSQPRVLRQRELTDRPTIVFRGQTIPTEEITIPDITPVWLESVNHNINSLQSFIVNGIIPFELVRGINRLLNPRIQLQEGPQVVDMPSLLQRIQVLAQEDVRRLEILSFARVIDNYYTSLEAPARMEIGIPITRCEIKPCSSSQGDDPHAAQKYGKKHTLKRTHFPMSPVNLCRTEKVFQEIVEMARLADNILRLYGTNATFAVWSPYGPGPSGLKRLFLIFEGVIEPTEMVARIAGEGTQLQAEIVTAFNIITGDNPITADATAIARVISTTTEAEVTHVGSRPEFISSSGAAVVAEEKTKLEIMPNLLNIPIRDAYLAWYAALWTQSSLNYEYSLPQRTLQEHYATVEFTLGYIIGTRYNHIPTFYQFRLQRPIEDIMERCSRGSTWLCNLLSVDEGEQRIVKRANDPTLISGINYAASEWRQVANSSALFGSRVATANIAVESANQIQKEAELQLVGGGVRDNHIQFNLSPTDDIPAFIELTIYPVVQLQKINIGGGGGSEIIIPTQITTLDNATVIAELSEPEIAELVIKQVTEQGQGRGIRGKKGMKRLTRKGKKGRKGCKGTKKRCKGKKGRGRSNGSKRRTSNQGIPTNTMRILKQKLKL